MISSYDIGFLFDLDGVIIDSEKEYSRMWKIINNEFPTGISLFEQQIKGCTLDMILSTFYKDEETREKVKNRLYELEKKMKYEYLPGADRVLKFLCDEKIPHALVTSSNDEKMKHLEEEIPGLKERFDFIVTSEFIQNSKPHPEGYLLAANKLNVSPKRCVVFEDSLQGVKAGKNAGAYVVGIAGTIDNELLSEFSDIIKDSLDDVEIELMINILQKR